MQIIHADAYKPRAGRKAKSTDPKAVYERERRLREKVGFIGKRLDIGPLTFVEHNDSIDADLVGGPTLYAFWGGLKLTREEIEARVK